MLGERRLWAFALEMVPMPGKRAVNPDRRSAETVLEGKVAVAFFGRHCRLPEDKAFRSHQRRISDSAWSHITDLSRVLDPFRTHFLVVPDW